MCGGTDRGNVAPRWCCWAGHAAAVWAALFAAPHLWWAFGISTGFPGGSDGWRAARAVPWFVAYDLLIVVLSCAAALVALATVRRWTGATLLAWGACGLLLSRGIAGLVVDGLSDLVWSPMFVAGGLLFAVTAWGCGRLAHGAG